MSHFPPEIYGQIVPELSKRDLWSFSLVSPSTVDEANRILYRDVDFSSLPVNLLARDRKLNPQEDKPISSFFRTISSSPRLASLVNTFAFRTPYHPDSDIDPGGAMRSLINLRSLSITSILSSDKFPAFLHGCTSNLEVFHATFPLDPDFLAFIMSTPKLRLLSFGSEKVPASIGIDLSLCNKGALLSSLTTLFVNEGAILLVPYCTALTHLDVRMSERQSISIALDSIKTIGSQLVSLTWHQGLYYGNEAIVQYLPSLAEATPNLERLNVVVHFCGGWGNPPCAQYAADIESLDLSDSWLKLESIVWKSHLSCHDHLVYWDGLPLCNHAFATLPTLRRMTYTEECRLESNSSVTLCYERSAFGLVESEEICNLSGKRLRLT